MTDERYNALMRSDVLPLTEAEIADGWHFCWEFDGLLIGPGWIELEFCHCFPKEHKVYLTIAKPPE